MRGSDSSADSKRLSGFTRIELGVVTVIALVVSATLFPRLLGAREKSRQTQCLDNLRHLSLGVHEFMATNGGKMPHLTTGIIFDEAPFHHGQSINVGTPKSPIHRETSWAIHLLPFIDHMALYEQLTKGAAQHGEMTDLFGASIKEFNCADDPDSGSPGNLSFVANAGYIPVQSWASSSTHHRVGRYDWSFTPDQEPSPFSSIIDDNESATFSTGVFWREANSTSELDSLRRPKIMTLDAISRGDGLSTTVLLSENLNTTRFSVTGDQIHGGWSSDATPDIAFMLSVKSIHETTFTGIDTAIDGVGLDTPKVGLSLADSSGNRFRLSGSKLTDTSACRINSHMKDSPEGQMPRPSSHHPGGVHFSFCDGQAKLVSQNIDDQIYANLLSSNGGAYGQPIIGRNDF